MADISKAFITGNLTRDPELRNTQSGTAVCKLRVAVNTRTKAGGEWTEKPNYFDVTVWGAQGESVATHLSKGSGVVIDGRLEWREWEANDGSGKRQAVEIVAENVRFAGRGGERSNGSGGAAGAPPVAAPAAVAAPAPVAGAAVAADDDIPF